VKIGRPVVREINGSLQLNRLMANNQELAHQTVMQAFSLTLTQAKLLVLLLRHIGVSRQHIEMSGIDVHIFYLRRKLKPFGVAIDTLWGEGYLLSSNNRRKVTELILAAMS
jgi:DNA-binding response OmpR family regulator